MQFKSKLLGLSLFFSMVATPLFTGCYNHGGGGPTYYTPQYVQVFTEKEMLFMAMLNEVDAIYNTIPSGATFDLHLNKHYDGSFTVDLGSTTLATFQGTSVTFDNNATNANNATYGGAVVTAVTSGINVLGTLLDPSLGIDSLGIAFFPITFGVVQPTDELIGTIKGYGRVVNDLFAITFDPTSFLQFITNSRFSSEDDGSIIAPSVQFGHLHYGTFRLEYSSIYLTTYDHAHVDVNLYSTPVP